MTGFKKKTLWPFFMDEIQPPQVINIFGRDYSNLNNPIPSKEINLQHTSFIVGNRDNI